MCKQMMSFDCTSHHLTSKMGLRFLHAVTAENFANTLIFSFVVGRSGQASLQTD